MRILSTTQHHTAVGVHYGVLYIQRKERVSGLKTDPNHTHTSHKNKGHNGPVVLLTNRVPLEPGTGVMGQRKKRKVKGVD